MGVIEKHVDFVGSTGPDAPHSLTGEEFKAYVASIRRVTAMPKLYTTDRDMDMRHKRRLKAITQINQGDTFKYGVNFGIFRSLTDDAKASHPFYVDQIDGKKSTKTILVGDGIWVGEVE